MLLVKFSNMKIRFEIIFLLHLLYSVECDSSENNNNSAKCDSNTLNCEPFSLQNFHPSNIKRNTTIDRKILDNFNTIESQILLSDMSNQENGNFSIFIQNCAQEI